MGSPPPAVRQLPRLSARAALGLLAATVIVIAASFIAMHVPAFRSTASGAIPASMHPSPQRSSGPSHETTPPEGSMAFHVVSVCVALVGTFLIARRIVQPGHAMASMPPPMPRSVPSRDPTNASIFSLLCIQRC